MERSACISCNVRPYDNFDSMSWAFDLNQFALQSHPVPSRVPVAVAAQSIWQFIAVLIRSKGKFADYRGDGHMR